MSPQVVGERHVLFKSLPRFPYGCRVLAGHLLILHRPPEALHDDVVSRPPASIHADLHALVRAQPHAIAAGTLSALVRRDNLWARPVAECLQECLTTPRPIERS